MIGVSHVVPGDRLMIIVMQSREDAEEYIATVPKEFHPKLVNVATSPVEPIDRSKKDHALAQWRKKRKTR